MSEVTREDARKICVVSGSRAEYGLLRWLMQDIVAEPELRLQLVVTGAHLDPISGDTWRDIVRDGFVIDEKIDAVLSADSSSAITKSLGLATIGFADALARLQPDLLVLLGDRYEILAAAQAAMLTRIPIAHIHGGESTEGAIDEAIRHAVTKMSHIHCVAAEPYARRVEQLGEAPASIHQVGASGLDTLERLTLLNTPALEQHLGYSIGTQHLLVTYHPVTLSDESPVTALTPLLQVLEQCSATSITITGANADPSGRQFNRLLQGFAQSHAHVHFSHSLGQLRYLSLASQSLAVIGNSSSGLIEIPSLGVATINIGDRQRSRLRASSVIDCANQKDAIRAALEQASTPAFQKIASQTVNPYGSPGSAQRIVKILRDTPLEGLLMKHFHDIA